MLDISRRSNLVGMSFVCPPSGSVIALPTHHYDPTKCANTIQQLGLLVASALQPSASVIPAVCQVLDEAGYDVQQVSSRTKRLGEVVAKAKASSPVLWKLPSTTWSQFKVCHDVRVAL